MSLGGQTRQLEFEAAERRLIEHLRADDSRASSARRVAVLSAAALLFAATFLARLAIHDPDALLANFYVVPIALLAIEFGTVAGVLAAAAGIGLVFAWSEIQAINVNLLGYTSRAAAMLVTGAGAGWFPGRLRQDIAARQRAQRQLSLYAEQLERANQHLARSVERLEAFAEIARAVGGETDLQRVLALILEHGREIVAAGSLIVHLPAGDALIAMSGIEGPDDGAVRVAIAGSLPGEVLLTGRPLRVTAEDRARQLEQLTPGATAAILVPLVFRGATLGVLAAIRVDAQRAFEREDEQLLMSIAASAATAVATARSVAAERLRISIEAAEQARARWARELHDETLQGLTGVRMVLSAGLAHDDLVALRRAAQTAELHLGEETSRLRDLVAELRPAALDDLGLGPAIESLARRQAAGGGLDVKPSIELRPRDRLARETEIAIYRIVQEALSNVVRHSGAGDVALSVRQLTDRIEIPVRDDGHGFEPDEITEGFGLAGMRERAVLAGGRLSLQSGPGGPTCLIAVLPVRSRSSTT